MNNKLIQWLKVEMGDQSIRKLAQQLDLSHSYVAHILKGQRPVSWEFAARVSCKMGLDLLEAFRMAGLWDEEKKGDAEGSPAPASPPGESH